MAEYIIPHTPAACQVAKLRFLTDFKMRDLLIIEVLNSTNERAAEFLRECGFSSFLPTTEFSTARAIINFYGVTKNYLTGICSRYSLYGRHMREDVIETWAQSMVKSRISSGKCIVLPGSFSQSTERIKDVETGEELEICNRIQNFYSARLILAMSIMMCHGRTIPADSKVLDVYLAICESPYADAVFKAVKKTPIMSYRSIFDRNMEVDEVPEHKKPEPNAPVPVLEILTKHAESAPPIPTGIPTIPSLPANAIRVDADSNVIISPEFFTQFCVGLFQYFAQNKTQGESIKS